MNEATTANTARTTQSHVVVIDSGSGKIRAGFAGEKEPLVTFPNIVGTVTEGEKPGYYIGNDVYKMRDREKIFKRNLPIITGEIQK